jgi:hypothetical protein
VPELNIQTLVLLFIAYTLWRASAGSTSPLKAPSKPLPEDAIAKVASLESRMKTIEIEWEGVYEQMRRVAGRADREKALEAGASKPSKAAPPPPQVLDPRAARNAILRGAHEQTGTG